LGDGVVTLGGHLGVRGEVEGWATIAGTRRVVDYPSTRCLLEETLEVSGQSEAAEMVRRELEFDSVAIEAVWYLYSCKEQGSKGEREGKGLWRWWKKKRRNKRRNKKRRRIVKSKKSKEKVSEQKKKKKKKKNNPFTFVLPSIPSLLTGCFFYSDRSSYFIRVSYM